MANIHTRHMYLHTPCLFSEIYPHTSLSPDHSNHQFSNPVPPRSLMIQINFWLQPIHQYMITCLAISPSNQSEQPGTLPEVLPPGRISLHCCLLGMSQKGLWRYSCSLSSSVYLLCRIIYKTAPRLFFLLQLPLQ